jgi:hypothetical protein
LPVHHDFELVPDVIFDPIHIRAYGAGTIAVEAHGDADETLQMPDGVDTVNG